MTGPSSYSYENLNVEYVAVILAATAGTRLYPLTTNTTSNPSSTASSATTPTAVGGKHLLPVAGVPSLLRLILSLEGAQFTQAILTIHQDDAFTIPWLESQISQSSEGSKLSRASQWTGEAVPSSSMEATTTATTTGPSGSGTSSKSAQVCFRLETGTGLVVTVVRLTEACDGSVEALRQVEGCVESSSLFPLLSQHSHMVVMPGDLVFLEYISNSKSAAGYSTSSVLADLVQTHRAGQKSQFRNNNGKSSSYENAAACTILLTDVGEQDEHGVPLKESAKQKKGGLAREEDEIEYIALGYSSSSTASPLQHSITRERVDPPVLAPRVLWKRSKLEVEEDKDMTGASPKLVLPKARLFNTNRNPQMITTTRVRTDWTDVHVYVLSPWVRALIRGNRSNLLSLQDDLIPLLVSRQFSSIYETFGSKVDRLQVDEQLRGAISSTNSAVTTLGTLDGLTGVRDEDPTSTAVGVSSGISALSIDINRNKTLLAAPPDEPYAVLAYVQTSALRSSTVPAYLYASREMMARAAAATFLGSGSNNSNNLTTSARLSLPQGATVRDKFQTVIGKDCKIGDKVTFKSTVVGHCCTLAAKCRLNNVILQDHVTLGENVSLQNTVVGQGAVVGDNCSLNDCQVAPGKRVESGTKAKSEALVDDESMII